MATEIFATAGSILRIGAALAATHNKAGMEAVTWTNIGLISDLSGIGKTFSETTYNPVDTRATIPVLTSSDNGEMSITYAYTADEDDGQVALEAAIGQKLPFSLILPSGKYKYFNAWIKGGIQNLGTVEDVITQVCALRVTEDEILTEDAPASA